MFQNKFVEKIKTHFMFGNFFPKIVTFMRDYVGKYCRAIQTTDENVTWRMRFPCWILKATDKHSEYVTFIVFPLQQWLQERASVLRCTNIACLVYCINNSVHVFHLYLRYVTLT